MPAPAVPPGTDPSGTDPSWARLSRICAALIAGGLLLLASAGLLWTRPVVPLFLVLAVLLAVTASLEARRVPWPDPVVVALVAALLAWGGLTATWAIVPAEALDRALKLAGTLVLILPLFSAPVAGWLGRRRIPLPAFLAAGLVIGAILLTIEHVFGFPLYRMVHGLSETDWQDSSIENLSVHNRGVTYLAVLAWPAAAFLSRGGRWQGGGRIVAAAMIALALGCALLGSSSSAVIGCLLGIATFLLAQVVPRTTRRALAAAVVVMAALTPVLLPALFQALPRSGGHIPHSFHHRLEIYDFTAERISERPLLGWGLDNARYLPINEEDIPRYQIFDRPPTHPHNAFLQARVETGLPGLVLLAGIMLTGLFRTARLPAPVQPFALASFATILSIASVSYSLWSSSWFIVIIIAAFLFFTQSAGARTTDPHPPAEPTTSEFPRLPDQKG